MAPDPQIPIWTIREIVERLERRVEELERVVDAVKTRVNYAVGGVAVIGVTALINTITNILQTPGVVK